jgi:hypothetical protein
MNRIGRRVIIWQVFGEPRGNNAESQLTLNRTLVFWSWAFGARAGLRSALRRACVPMALDPEEIVTLLLLAALVLAWNWRLGH